MKLMPYWRIKPNQKMTINRRQFVVKSLKAGAIGIAAGSGLLACSTEENSSSEESAKLKILILGGTSFLGPHQVEYALERGHSVSTFTRGKTMPTVHQEVFDKVEMLIGDREDNLESLKDREWDVVIDNSGRKVEWTEKTAQLLKDNVGTYIYTSSTGVYYPYLSDNITEDTELVLEMPESLSENEQYEQAYGIMKANSELAAIKHFGPERTIVMRPTYMIGPGDKLDRFIHWPVRLRRGGDVMVPGKLEDPVQFMDVRDVAQWMIRMAENKANGIYNAVGPEKPMNIAQFSEELKMATDQSINIINVDDYEFLEEVGVYYIVPWVRVDGKNYGSARVDNELAIVNGLTFIPLAQSIRDTQEWWYSDALTEDRRQEFETNPDQVISREADILAAWTERNS